METKIKVVPENHEFSDLLGYGKRLYAISQLPLLIFDYGVLYSLDGVVFHIRAAGEHGRVLNIIVENLAKILTPGNQRTPM